MMPLRGRLQRVGLLESRDAVRRLSRGPVELRELVEPYGATGPRQALGRDGRQRLPGPASLAEEALGSAEPKRDLRVVAEGESVLPRLRRRGVLALSVVFPLERDDAKALQDLGALRHGLRRGLRVNDGRQDGHEVNDQAENHQGGKAQPRWN